MLPVSILLAAYLQVNFGLSDAGPSCFSCPDSANSSACSHIRTCPTGQKCSEKLLVSTSGRLYFEAGCTDIQTCSTVQSSHSTLDDSAHRRSSGLAICLKCCDGNFCNENLCGPKQTVTNPMTRCFSCSDVLHPGDCDSVTSCMDGDACSVSAQPHNGRMTYRLGCMNPVVCNSLQQLSPSLIGKRDLRSQKRDLLSACCYGDLCNWNLDISGKPGVATTTISVPSAAGNLQCVSCQSIRHPEDCGNAVDCSNDELCSLAKEYHNGQMTFRLGCMRKVMCDSLQLVGKRDQGPAKRDVLAQCCHGNLCNWRWITQAHTTPQSNNRATTAHGSTVPAFKTTTTTFPLTTHAVPAWTSWQGFTCTQLDTGCMAWRIRNCTTGRVSDCPGRYYDSGGSCSPSVCPSNFTFTTVTPTTSTPTRGSTNTALLVCQDKPSFCDGSGLSVICADPFGARALCPVSCGLCGTTTQPPITIPVGHGDCQDDASVKDCGPEGSPLRTFLCADPDMAVSLCPKSCNRCNDVCRDSIGVNCSSSTIQSYFCSKPSLAVNYCRKTCNACNAPLQNVKKNSCGDPAVGQSSCSFLHNEICLCKESDLNVLCSNYCAGRCGETPKPCTVTGLDRRQIELRQAAHAVLRHVQKRRWLQQKHPAMGTIL